MALDAFPAPPIPPRPRSSASYHHDRTQCSQAVPPPIPPLPPGFRPHEEDIRRPHSAGPMQVPAPQQRNVIHPSHMMHGFNTQAVSYNGVARFASPAPAPLPHMQQQQGMMNAVPRFIGPSRPIPFRGTSPAPSYPPFPPPPSVPGGAAWHREPSADVNSVASLMATTSLVGSSLPRAQSVHGVIEYSAPRPPLPPSTSPNGRRFAAPLPTITTLQNALSSVQSPATDDASRVAWIRDVLFLVKRDCVRDSPVLSSGLFLASNSFPSGSIQIIDPALRHLAESAVALLIALMPTLPARDEKLTLPLAEALYIRAELTASGAFPNSIPASPRNAFREFEAAARSGFSHSWFRLGRDYEGFDDIAHARQCFEKGVDGGDVGCVYRMGMARLLGQLNFPANNVEGVEQATQLLHRAAASATIEFPYPPYVFALFLLDEFEHVSISFYILAPYIPAGSSPALEARRHLERAAFLHYTPAQQRIGRAYEFAEAPFPFDPILSVEYYALASAGGDAQADLGLSKWYLCGAEGAFNKDELRARECAERGASRGLPAAKFAMGYYCEVGIGGLQDIQQARRWYTEAAELGEAEAEGRLKALVDTSMPLSREDHNALAETKLVRKRTQARIRSDAATGRDGNLSSQTVVHRQPDYVVPQRRQASLPTPMPSNGQYGPGVHPALYQPLPRHAASLPPQIPSGQPNDVGHEQSQYASGQGQQFSDRPRYSLVDPGVAQSIGNTPAPFAGMRRVASNGPPVRRQYTGSSTTSGLPHTSSHEAVSALPSEADLSANTAPSTGAKKYTTFAEMGIEGKRAEDKECVIM